MYSPLYFTICNNSKVVAINRMVKSNRLCVAKFVKERAKKKKKTRMGKLAELKNAVEIVDDSTINFKEEELDNGSSKDVTFVRVIYTDTSGQRRCRVIPRQRFNTSVEKHGVGLSGTSMGRTSHSDCLAVNTNINSSEEIILVPDLSTKCTIPWTKHQEMVLADMFIQPGKASEYCPREALRRVSKILKDEFDLVVDAGFEIEFYLLKSVLRDGKEEWVPFDRTSYCSTSAFDAASLVLEEIFASLESLNITVEQLHAEAGKGQFEIALRYTDCGRAANNLIYTREVIRAVARKHGLLATFLPKYALDEIGSGSHVHISLSRNGENVFMASDGSSRYGMSKIGEAFMAGVFDHLPAILAFSAPLPNSYDRIQPGMSTGAYLCWGKENREAPLRAASPPGVAQCVVSNFEIKAFDGCANPYLGLASIITAGIDGLRRNLSLPEPIDVDPHILKGNLQRLPVSLSESVEALEKDTVFKNMIGEKLLIAIIGVRKAEVKYYSENKEAYKDLIYKY